MLETKHHRLIRVHTLDQKSSAHQGCPQSDAEPGPLTAYSLLCWVDCFWDMFWYLLLNVLDEKLVSWSKAMLYGMLCE